MGSTTLSWSSDSNALTGQLQGAPTVASINQGTVTSNGQYGRVAYGRNQSGRNLTAEFSLELTPRLGYFVLDGLLVEAAIGLRHIAYKLEGDRTMFNQIEVAQTDAELGVLVHYYPLRQGRLLPYVNAGWGYLRLQQETQGFNGQANATVASAVWQAGAGALYFLSSQLAVDLTVNYNTGEAKFGSDLISSSGLRERQLRGGVGLRFFLPAR